MIVVDTQILVYLVLPVSTARDHQQSRAVLTRDPRWAAPQLWRSEFINVCAGYIPRGDISIVAAGEAVARAELAVATEAVSADSVIQLIPTSRCSAYDLEFVALANSLGIPLVTNDKQVLAAFPETAVSPETFAP